MFDHLQIYEPRERLLVGLADAALWPLRLEPRRRRRRPRRVLLLRLERIGDLLMVRRAIELAREALPDAKIDLAVGSWNAPVAALLPGVTRVEVADAPWLARPADPTADRRSAGGPASAAPGVPSSHDATWALLSERTRDWRGQYDLVVNFEPDIRSNLVAWLTRAPRRFGYWTGGGGALLTDALAYDPTRHVEDNACALVARALGLATDARPAARTPLGLPAVARRHAGALLDGAAQPLIGVHPSGGRASKQWHLDRFAAVARGLHARYGGTIVLTGAAADRPLVDAVRHQLAGVSILDAAGEGDLLELAALLERLDLFVSGDTGPMHLAAAVGTPVVALFGPSDPRRYGPLTEAREVVRIDLPCSPCGRVRLPPERCRGHVPDCLDGISVDQVLAAAARLLAAGPHLEPPRA